MYLLDTNIFLEILLAQDKNEHCKKFIADNTGNLNISDFSLYSIGIVLFRIKDYNSYLSFSKNISEIMQIKSMPFDEHQQITKASQKFNLDFDDAYQYSIANFYGLNIVTMDKDFKRAKDIEVVFL